MYEAEARIIWPRRGNDTDKWSDRMERWTIIDSPEGMIGEVAIRGKREGLNQRREKEGDEGKKRVEEKEDEDSRENERRWSLVYEFP